MHIVKFDPAKRPRRKLTLVFSCLLMGLSFSLGAQADLVASYSSVTANTTDNFFVTIALRTRNNQLLDAVEFHMGFDPTILQVVGLTASPDNPLTLPLFDPSYNNSTGTIDYGAGTLRDFTASDHDLVQIEFRAVRMGISALDFNIFEGPASTMATFNGANVLGILTGMEIIIEERVTPASRNGFRVMIHPNPGDTEFTIDFTDPVSVEQIFIYDMNGRLVKDVKGDPIADVQTYSLKVQDLPNALYVVKIRYANGYERQQSVIIKHH